MKRFVLILLILSFISHSILAQQDLVQNDIDTELAILRTDPVNKEALRKVSFLYLNIGDYKKARHYAQQLQDIGYQQQDYNRSVIYSHIALGQAAIMQGDSSMALSNLGQAESIGLTNHNDSALCSVYNGLGLFESSIKRDYYRALTYYFKGMEAAKRSHYTRLYSILTANISEIYYLKNDTAGLTYSLECYRIGHQQHDPSLIYYGATNTAYMYYLKKDYDKAYNYIREAEFVMTQNHFLFESIVYNTYGLILTGKKKYAEALTYYNKAIEQNHKQEFTSQVNSHLGKGIVYTALRQFDLALKELYTALDIADKNNVFNFRDRVLLALSQCFEAQGNYRQSLLWHQQYTIEHDSLYQADKERAVNEIKARYDLERHENIIKQHRLELLSRRNKELILISILIIIVVASLLLFYLYWHKNKLYIAIVKQNQQSIAHEQALLDKIKELQLSSSPGTTGSCRLTNEKKDEIFARFETLLKEERIYTDNLLTVDKVAKQLGTNRTYLSQVINEQVHQTFTQYINAIRIKEAIRILSDANNHAPLKAITAELGFNSSTTFYSLFQTTTGMTPTQYRNKVQELQNNK